MSVLVTVMPAFCGAIIIATIVICKYFAAPKIFAIISILACILYQIDFNKKNGNSYKFEDTLINVSKFFIISAILGYITVRIVELFSLIFN